MTTRRRGDTSRSARLVDLLEEAEDVEGEHGVEVASGLVGQHDGGLGDDGPRDGHALLLAAGEHRDALVAAAVEADALEGERHAGAHHARLQAHHLEGHRDVLVHGPVRHEAEVLEHHADVAAQVGNAVLGEPRDVATAEEDAAVVHGLGAVDQLEERALARARRAGDEDELAALDGQVDAAQHRRVGAEHLEHVLEHEDRLVRRRAIEVSFRPEMRSEFLRGTRSTHARPVLRVRPRLQKVGRIAPA